MPLSTHIKVIMNFCVIIVICYTKIFKNALLQKSKNTITMIITKMIRTQVNINVYY